MFDSSFEPVPTIEKPVNCGVLLILELSDGGYWALQPTAVNSAMSWIEVVDDNHIDVKLGTMGTDEIEVHDVPIFAYGRGDDIYELINDIWCKLSEDKHIKDNISLRKDKVYPEQFNYLGWCSWEHFRKNINEKVLLEAADEIEHSDIPIRWLLVDHGHQTQINDRLINFSVSKEKFPDGWSTLLAKQSDKLRWFGLWHCMYGIWGGIHPDNDMDDLKPYLMRDDRGRIILDGSPEAADLFYDKLVSSAADNGFDFIKVDVQTRDFNNYLMTSNPVESHHNNAVALERYSRKKLDGMMNCMAQNLPCVFNTKYSATTRVSVDYKLNNVRMARNHIYQGFQNTLWMGQTVWPDHDMFHSSDEKLGRLMAVSKAMSAAPIYLSDPPKSFVKEYISPLAFSDGKILRPLAPAVPLPKSMFDNVLMGKGDYYVIAPLTRQTAAITAYNISNKNTGTVMMEICEDDYTHSDAMVQPYPGKRTVPEEGLAFYDWYEKKGGKLDDRYCFELGNMEDKLILLSEIHDGWAIIGQEGKYLSPVSVIRHRATRNRLHVSIQEDCPFLIYSESPVYKCTDAIYEELDNGLYLITPDTGKKKFVIYSR